MIRPFAGSTITNIVLDKIKQSNAPLDNIYLSAYDQELKDIANFEEIKDLIWKLFFYQIVNAYEK